MNSRNGGFTLLELLLVTTTLSILLIVSIPAFSYMLETTRVSTYVNSLTNIIRASRHYAVSESTPITLCTSNDQTNCLDTQQWNHPIVAFQDLDGDGTISGNETIIASIESPPNGYQLTWNNFTRRPYFQYSPLGSSAYLNGNLSLCPEDGDLTYARQIIINRQGRPRLATDEDTDGIVNGANGRNIDCS